MSFSMNYTIDIDIDRRLASIKIYGVWKRETAQEYHKNFREVVQPLIGQPWAKIVNLNNWKSSYPEMISVIGDHMKWSRENGNVLAIYVIDNPVTKNQLKKMFTAGLTTGISLMVRTMEEAEKILVEHGY